MEKEKKYQGKGKNFLSKNIYYVIMAVCVLLIAAMITVVALATKNENNVTTPTVNTGETQKPVETEDPVDDPIGGVEEPVDTTPKTTFILPVEDATVGLDYSVDALVFYASLNNWQVHKGTDFLTETPTDVKAAMDGTVENVSTDALNGTVVVLSHEGGYKTVYKSLSDATVKVGDKVKQGEVLGKTSMSMATEASQGNHLHFELQKDGKTVDPNLYLPTADK